MSHERDCEATRQNAQAEANNKRNRLADMNKTIYVVGKVIEEVESGQVWEIHGIYEKEHDAVSRCLDVTYFVGPIEINKGLPVEREDWLGCYFPKNK